MVQTTDLNMPTATIPMASKVLIVDDEPDIVEEVVEQLEDEGLQCVSAFGAVQAMDLIKNDTDIGVVVTDIRMPGMDGLEMARRLNKNYEGKRDLFVIVVTGHAGMKEAIEALQLGAEDFLTKPISPDHLLHSVRRAGEIIQLRANERLYKDHLEQEVTDRTAEVQHLADNLAEQNQELTIVNRLKDEFLQMMSHELNTPLNAVIGFSQLLMDMKEDDDPEKRRKCAENINLAGMRLTRTVDSILTLSSITAGELTQNYSQFSAQNFVDAVESEHSHLSELWGSSLHCSMADRSFEIEADFNQLQKATGHLIENAARHSGEGGKVSMFMELEDGHLHILVSDNGPGMTPKQTAIALEPMRQIDGSIGRKFEGMGLGLPLAKGIVEAHGGEMQIDSTPGVGTTVTLDIPVRKG
ncbi:MAG: hybrid sensor histidine kinase/response regulator [Rhodospirillaceae bacterium]|jgi:signal transduction histidine kinase|nr:hybrid sensor histidine kinase/response regulator [Rhodospirillaceae bacterium]MBT4218866.1 hybrid sensor histidine kinase/response regulator [Rhodospirillaceae bacterium]MBT4463731.1 hybrid sensor histidine kinase/response regulator [Rhodospirillaceae bacterium]MBT5309860.1 hybrid sensor histidine kinase/response regulator [Rhodospirillaceae bacterium]MBT6406700.1 hybrid sensor histidine kinase/response regulator [Rhodospirillaceae bacterium]